MKKELFTTIAVAIIGTVVAFLVCNMITGEIQPFSFNTVDDSDVNADLTDPDPEVFNYRSINPTVEVYVSGDNQEGS